MTVSPGLRIALVMMLLLIYAFPGNALQRISPTPVLHSVLDDKQVPTRSYSQALRSADPGSDALSGHANHLFFDDPKTKPQYDYKRQQRIAITLTVSGSVLSVLGGAALISAANEPPDTDGDSLLAFQTMGVLFLIAGLCMLIPGIVRLTRL